MTKSLDYEERMSRQELLNMKLHELKTIDDRLLILRVFGGWIYHHLNQCVFVPEVLDAEAQTVSFGYP